MPGSGSASSRRTGVEQGVDEPFGIEQLQVVDLLADADVLDRQAHLRRIATTTPPLAVPSSLASTMPVHFHRFVKMLRLADAVLAGRGVEHQQHFVRRVGDLVARSRAGSW